MRWVIRDISTTRHVTVWGLLARNSEGQFAVCWCSCALFGCGSLVRGRRHAEQLDGGLITGASTLVVEAANVNRVVECPVQSRRGVRVRVAPAAVPGIHARSKDSPKTAT